MDFKLCVTTEKNFAMSLLHRPLLTPSPSLLLQSRTSCNPSPAAQPTRFLLPRPLRLLSTSLQPHGNSRNQPALPICGCTTSDLAISQEAPPPSSRIFIKGLFLSGCCPEYHMFRRHTNCGLKTNRKVALIMFDILSYMKKDNCL